MVRGLTGRAALAAAGAGWNQFFHGRCDARRLAWVRIALGLLLAPYFAVLFPDLATWFGEHGLVPRAAWLELRDGREWSLFAAGWLPGDERTLACCWGACLVQSLLLAAGLWPRFQAACLFVWLVSFQHRNPLLWDGEDAVFRLLTGLLIFADSGRVWSLDAALRGGLARWLPGRSAGGLGVSPSPAGHSLAEPPQVAIWPLRLIQLQMCVMLFAAGVCKLGGESWLRGEAFYYVTQLHDYYGRFPLPAGLGDWPWAVRALTWGTLILELAAPVLLWFRDTRRAMLVLLVLFHLACDYSLHLFLFHWVMLAGWLSFVEPEDFRRA